MTHATILYSAAKAYVRTAMDLLANTVPAISSESLPIREWVRSDNVFLTRNIERPYWNHGIVVRYEILHALPEYRLYVQALKEDLVAGSNIGVILTARGGRQVTAAELADRLLWKLTEKNGGFNFDEASFNILFDQFLADIRRDYLDYVMVAPLPGLTADLHLILLGSDFELAELNDDELKRCLSISIYPGVDLGGVVLANKTCGLRYRFSEKKFLGEVPPDEMKRAQDRSKSNNFTKVLHALRLFKRGNISIPGIATFTDQWPMEGLVAGSPIDPSGTRFNNYELTSDELERFQNLWRILDGSTFPRFIDTAVRRFAYAGERRRPEDRLVDLLISAESLFLSDTAQASERGELRYRLALRVAFFVELEGYSRRDLYRFMRFAYDARSAVVHGSLPDDNSLKVPQKGKVSLAEFVDFAEDVLRGGLLKGLKHGPLDERTLADWDSLILD